MNARRLLGLIGLATASFGNAPKVAANVTPSPSYRAPRKPPKYRTLGKRRKYAKERVRKQIAAASRKRNRP